MFNDPLVWKQPCASEKDVDNLPVLKYAIIDKLKGNWRGQDKTKSRMVGLVSNLAVQKTKTGRSLKHKLNYPMCKNHYNGPTVGLQYCIWPSILLRMTVQFVSRPSAFIFFDSLEIPIWIYGATVNVELFRNECKWRKVRFKDWSSNSKSGKVFTSFTSRKFNKCCSSKTNTSVNRLSDN